MAEVEFRDGTKEVPDHLADMMKGLPTHNMTEVEATIAANESLINNRFTDARQKMVVQHFKDLRAGE
jgi:hypothetical protein